MCNNNNKITIKFVLQTALHWVFQLVLTVPGKRSVILLTLIMLRLEGLPRLTPFSSQHPGAEEEKKILVVKRCWCSSQ